MSAAQAQTIYEIIRGQADRLGNAVAVQGLKAADLTYSELVAQIDRIAAALSAWGIGRGDRVVIQLPHGPEVLLVMHGVGAIGVAVLIDPRATAPEVDRFLRFTEPTAIVLQQGLESAGRAVAQSLGVRVIDIIPTPESGAGSLLFAEPPPSTAATPILNEPTDVAFMIATSGTTSLPKLVPKTQRAMLKGIESPFSSQFAALHERIPMQMLNYLPMHLAYGAWVASAALISGGLVACMPGLDPGQFYQWLDRYRPNFLSGPPGILEQLLPMADENHDIIARHRVRYISTSSAPMSEDTRVGLYRAFGVPMAQIYSMTEVAAISLGAASVKGEPISSLGRVADLDHTRIMAADGAFLPRGQVGEIVIRSEDFTGYWNNPEANDESFVDGWFRTGDEGSIDADGNLTIVGRIKEIINSGGTKVSPYEVETVLKQHPQVQDAAVFGLHHPEIGETVAAAVVGSVSERELRKFASERLPFYKVPMRIIAVDKIPVTASGKVPRNRLAEWLGLK